MASTNGTARFGGVLLVAGAVALAMDYLIGVGGQTMNISAGILPGILGAIAGLGMASGAALLAWKPSTSLASRLVMFGLGVLSLGIVLLGVAVLRATQVEADRDWLTILAFAGSVLSLFLGLVSLGFGTMRTRASRVCGALIIGGGAVAALAAVVGEWYWPITIVGALGVLMLIGGIGAIGAVALNDTDGPGVAPAAGTAELA